MTDASKPGVIALEEHYCNPALAELFTGEESCQMQFPSENIMAVASHRDANKGAPSASIISRKSALHRRSPA